MKSHEVTESSVYSRNPFNSPSEASFILAHKSLYETPFFNTTVKSTTETLTVGTLKAIPVSFPFNSGITNPTALAAPVVLGMMLMAAALPALQSFPPGALPSTVT
jgi:hypothetical protein